MKDIIELRAVGWQPIEACGIEVREHIGIARRLKGGAIYLDEDCIMEDRVVRGINGIKKEKNKAVGMDKKPELYKELAKSTVLMSLG